MALKLAHQLFLQQRIAFLGPQPAIDSGEQRQVLVGAAIIVMMWQRFATQMAGLHGWYPWFVSHWPGNISLAACLR